jgi:rare lipoprotein A
MMKTKPDIIFKIFISLLLLNGLCKCHSNPQALTSSGSDSTLDSTMDSILMKDSIAIHKAPAEPEIKETHTGLASFYGIRFHGKKTNSGEIFNKNEMVAAHPTYPFGTIVRVTNLDNNDTVQVRIIDHGPTKVNRKEGVIIDLSRAAAAKIRMIDAGRQKVRVDVLKWGTDKQDLQ